ncbi:serine/threonine protein kinase [Enorma phocaeensis]|uniref:serine/threonine protein kinase n=1 Tax=Enorma phocaeensis TaxID=1871019 RepID=UPI001958722C|nr:serine/threonine-protein kinase [Enorma phocaeensis]MBM6953387.1 serine/threonine protein kinase [Enorma phocaeensis]
MDTNDPTYHSPGDDVEQELDAYLEALRRDDCYRVLRRLSRSSDPACGTTELVAFEGVNGASMGPFVRKRLPRCQGLGDVYEELYRRERAGDHLQHLPRVIDCYKTASELVVVLEYVPGETLDGYVAREGASTELAARVMPRLCEAVAELHGSTPPVIHRDIKPQNIVVSPHAVTLIDLGIARRHRADARADTVRLGTRAYAPPEQFGFGQTDVRSDVYALGMVLWFCLTGKEPQGQPTAEALSAAGVPGKLARVVLVACSFDPSDRYPSALAMRDAVMGALAKGEGPSSCGARAPRRALGDVAATASAAGPAHAAGVPTPPETGSARSSRRGVRAGRLRNAFLIALCVLLLPALADAVQHPTGNNVGQPMWYLVVLAFGFIYPACVGGAYLALDKRRLYARFPAIASRTWKDDLKVYGIGLLVLFAVVVACNVATQS